MKRQFPDDVKLRVLKLAKEMHSITDICHVTKIPEGAVRKLLQEYGIKPAHKSNKRISESVKLDFVRMHVKDGMTYAEIARETGYSETSVRKTVKAFIEEDEANQENDATVYTYSLFDTESATESDDSEDVVYDDCIALDTIQVFNEPHKIYGCNERCGVRHSYFIHPYHDDPAYIGEHECYGVIDFQFGGRNEQDHVDGVLDSDLLEIVRDRLIGFQSGEFACDENEHVLYHVEEALMWLNRRIEDRAKRNVLGTDNK